MDFFFVDFLQAKVFNWDLFKPGKSEQNFSSLVVCTFSFRNFVTYKRRPISSWQVRNEPQEWMYYDALVSRSAVPQNWNCTFLRSCFFTRPRTSEFGFPRKSEDAIWDA